ncbi:MAG: hypothetical protein ACOYYS_18295 [Chloroflexota bacterium]
MRRKFFFMTLIVSLCVQLVFLLVAVPLLAKAMPWLAADAPQAGVPALVGYQGYLTSASGPINKPTNLWVGLYDTDQADANPIWQEDFDQVPVSAGYFTLELPLSAANFSTANRWIRIAIKEGETYTYLPLQRFTAVPYALQAANADTLDGKDSSAIAFAYGCRYTGASAAQSIPSLVWTPLTLDTQINDTTPGKNCHDTDFPSRLYARVAGCYLAGGGYMVNGPSIGSEERYLGVNIKYNGTVYLSISSMSSIPGAAAILSATSGMFYMNEGDYIEVEAYHNLTGAKSIDAATANNQFTRHAWLMRAGECPAPTPAR